MTENHQILEGQLRESFGRVVYSHKTHEKCADLLIDLHNKIKISQIVLSALVTGGLISSLFEFEFLMPWKQIGIIVTVVLSTALLVLNSYTKDYDLGEIAQKHRQAGSNLWMVREKYLSLLADLRMKAISCDEIRTRRDNLMEDLHAVYQGAPSTNWKAYRAAQRALKELEDMTFSDDEINAFLPKELKRSSTNPAGENT
jgi:hypothetical protein